MKIYFAYGATYIEYLDENDKVIGEDSGHRPVYYTWAEDEDQAHDYPLELWIETGDSNGTHGWDFIEGYSMSDVCDERTTLTEIYNIQEEEWTDSEFYPLKEWIEIVKDIDC